MVLEYFIQFHQFFKGTKIEQKRIKSYLQKFTGVPKNCTTLNFQIGEKI